MATILIVEDDKFLNRLYKDHFENEGIRAISLEDGTDVMKIVLKEKPDVILLDLIMPQKNGFDVLQELKANPDTKNVPVFVSSVLHQNEDIDRVKNMGAYAYLAKYDKQFHDVVNEIKNYLLRLSPSK